jgi:hypothetical protein
MSGDLIEFLRASLDERERDIRKSRSLVPGELHWAMPDWLDRDYLLVDIDAKRRIVAMHEPKPIIDPDGRERLDWPERVCRFCNPETGGHAQLVIQGQDAVSPEPEYCQHTRLLALPFADLPGHRPEWAPQ